MDRLALQSPLRDHHREEGESRLPHLLRVWPHPGLLDFLAQ